MASVLIRRARESDSAQLADVRVRSWRETYAGDLPRDTLDGLEADPDLWRERLRRVLAPGARAAVWVAEDDDTIVGFAQIGPDPEEEGLGRLFAIYVLRSAQGIGVGRRLHQAAVTSLLEDGFEHATLWVLPSNAAAIRFYELADWHADGATRVEDIAGTPLKVARYRLALRPAP